MIDSIYGAIETVGKKISDLSKIKPAQHMNSV